MYDKTPHNGLPLDSGGQLEDNPREQVDNLRELLNQVTQKTRFILIQNIVAHPKGMPSVKELVYANPNRSKSTIRNHLDQLIEYNIVETVELPKEQRQRDLPYKFYRLTDFGQNFLSQYDLLQAEDTWKEMYSMLEKTPEIQRYSEASRPDKNGNKHNDTDRNVAKPF